MTEGYCGKPYTYINSLRIVYEQRKFLRAIPLIHHSSWTDGVTCLLINIEGRWAEKNTAGITVEECTSREKKLCEACLQNAERRMAEGDLRLVCH